ncbi:hypothetical protein [Inquilinus sp.]|uniref:hypothetical protein n=1 Tax=Inquilinus sp. TaxID=1932117 RepID=UPI0031E0727D
MIQISRFRANRTFRNYTASALFGIGLANAAIFFSLLNQYTSFQPKEPHPDLGLIYQIKNHGAFNYISAAQETGLSLTSLILFLCVLATIIVIPKNVGTLSSGVQRPIATFDKPSWQMVGLCWAAFFVGLAILAFAGTWIVNAIVSAGVVLHWI